MVDILRLQLLLKSIAVIGAKYSKFLKQGAMTAKIFKISLLKGLKFMLPLFVSVTSFLNGHFYFY